MSRFFGSATRFVHWILGFAVLAAVAAAPISAAPGADPPRTARIAVPQAAPVPAGDTDKTLAALHDEIERSRQRLVLPGRTPVLHSISPARSG